VFRIDAALNPTTNSNSVFIEVEEGMSFSGFLNAIETRVGSRKKKTHPIVVSFVNSLMVHARSYVPCRCGRGGKRMLVGL
jgi:hypothetical protein